MLPIRSEIYPGLFDLIIESANVKVINCGFMGVTITLGQSWFDRIEGFSEE